MNKGNTIRILVVDDHFVVRMGIAALISTQPDMVLVGEAANGSQAVEMFAQYQPDVTLMDLRLPEMNGVKATAAILRKFPNARIIVLTVYDGDEDIYRALQAGARSYLLKDTLGKDLINVIRAVNDGQRPLPENVEARLAERMPRCELTVREIEVLDSIVKGLTNKEIADLLNIREGTVKIHVNSILSKLNVKDRTQAATSALKRGIIQL